MLTKQKFQQSSWEIRLGRPHQDGKEMKNIRANMKTYQTKNISISTQVTGFSKTDYREPREEKQITK